MISDTWCPQSVLAPLAQTGVMNDSTPSGLIHKQSRQIAVVDVGQQGPIPMPVHQRTINVHQFLTHPNCRDARSSVRSHRPIIVQQQSTPDSRDARSSVRNRRSIIEQQ